MELYQIRYFLNLADTLNFTRASERSFVSQPALTKAIQRLEEAVGGRLFHRTKSSVQLTEFGHAMLPSFQQLFDHAQHAKEQAQKLMAEQRAVLQIGLMCTVDMAHLLPGFSKCQQPDDPVEIAFTDGNLELIVDKLDQGDIDLAIMSAPYEMPKRFKSDRLFVEPFVVAFGAGHRFRDMRNIDLAALHQEPYCRRIECEFRPLADRMLDERNIVPHLVYQTAREDWVQAFVRSNFGVAFMPLSTVQRVGLDFTHISGDPIAREVSVYWHAERPMSHNKQRVIDMLLMHDWSSSAG